MGVLNVTPDSFSDGGRFDGPQAAIAAGLEMLEQGADIVDVGGESTRPGAPAVAVEQEIARVRPVIEGLRAAGATAISIDTRKAPVARAALDAGAGMVNDVSGGGYDPGLLEVVAAARVPYVVMHTRDIPERMQQGDIVYREVVADVRDWLAHAIERATGAGIARGRIVVDPGIGFGKTVDHNLALTRGLGELRSLGQAVMYGPSRKSFIGHLLGGAPPGDRLEGSLAAVVLGVVYGADLVRVHDVAAVRRALAVADAACRG
ncbi:MAG: dihydropteroate synthase [Deltaproteobacteria bacterium]|nr:dihydropteroate synthase [Deltaproteobacteria bacterium]